MEYGEEINSCQWAILTCARVDGWPDSACGGFDDDGFAGLTSTMSISISADATEHPWTSAACCTGVSIAEADSCKASEVA
jgi:hypothetical protein